MQLEDGHIDEATFAEIERDVFARMREMKGDDRVGGVADASSVRRRRDRDRRRRGFVTLVAT